MSTIKHYLEEIGHQHWEYHGCNFEHRYLVEETQVFKYLYGIFQGILVEFFKKYKGFKASLFAFYPYNGVEWLVTFSYD